MSQMPLTLYYVDDDPIERARVEKMAHMLVNPVIVCSNGADLLAHIDTIKHDQTGAVIMVDAMMNAATGATIINQLRSVAEAAEYAGVLNDMPMLLVTGPKSDEVIQKAADEGADAYIVKPITIDSLMNALRVVGDYRARIFDMRGHAED